MTKEIEDSTICRERNVISILGSQGVILADFPAKEP